MGGRTDLVLGSVADDSGRFARVSPMSEIDSGLGGGVSTTGSTGAAWAGAGAGCFALLIGGTADRRCVLASVCGFFLLGEIRSVAGWGGVTTFSAGAGSALGFAFWEGSFLLLARVAMNLSL